MPKRNKRFVDDGWAIWIDGDDTSTVYLNDWLNPKGKSYIDIAIRIRGIKISTNLYVYVPFTVEKNEITDVSLMFRNTKTLEATFSAACIVDFMKNQYTSEIAYNGKTIDIVHISTLEFESKPLASGTLIKVNLENLWPFLDNDEAYFIWRMPHKTIDEIFKPRVNVGNAVEKLRDLITSPVISEKYGYSIRINESRLLPEEISRIGAFHRQKLKKAVVTIALDENYEMNDSGCYRISRLEENLYKDYLPETYIFNDIISYQWNQTREHNLLGHFNFYNNISRNSISQTSMIIYLVLILAVGVFGNLVYDTILALISTFT